MKANYQDALKWLAEKSPFTTNLKQIMRANNTTQEQLANAIGVTKQTVSAYVNGQRVPDIYRAQQIADYFKVDVGYLLSNRKCFTRSTYPTKIQDVLTQIIYEAANGIETINVIEGFIDPVSWNMGNVIKYIYRWQHKDGLKDLKKAQFYLNRLIRMQEEKEEIPQDVY